MNSLNVNKNISRFLSIGNKIKKDSESEILDFNPKCSPFISEELIELLKQKQEIDKEINQCFLVSSANIGAAKINPSFPNYTINSEINDSVFEHFLKSLNDPKLDIEYFIENILHGKNIFIVEQLFSINNSEMQSFINKLTQKQLLLFMTQSFHNNNFSTDMDYEYTLHAKNRLPFLFSIFKSDLFKNSIETIKVN